MDRPPPRPIRRLLVANRGEIACRILAAARELGIQALAIYTSEDSSHTSGSHQAIQLSSPDAYLNITELISICKKHQVDAVHPGYGFLSESAVFSRRLWDEAGAIVVGPGWSLLDQTGDKLKARHLAEQCGVPTLPALVSPTRDIGDLKSFASRAGLPIMIKAVDGGGGRGIRLVRSADELEAAARRAIEESPSKTVFAEKAAVDGYFHVEVQVVGDSEGNIMHSFERQCSIQRRYQKVVEIAPCVKMDRNFVAKLIGAAVRMAKRVGYFSLGTFEFLANPQSQEYWFLEINPRLQVEHTITESIHNVDLVAAQLLIAQGATLSSSGLSSIIQRAEKPPQLYSCQLRITAENVHNDWSLSIGKIQSFNLPRGNGIRIDAALATGQVVSAAFDSLLAKLVITARTWDIVVQKAIRALEDTHIEGVKTNLDILRGIVSHPDFASGDCDTGWLEKNQAVLLKAGEMSHRSLSASSSSSELLSSNITSLSAPTFRPGDAWTVRFRPTVDKGATLTTHHLQIKRLLLNNFPASLSAEVAYTTPTTRTPQALTLALTSTAASASAATSSHRRANPGDPRHVVIPFAGTLVEVLVDEGDMVQKDDPLCVVRQMKMEIEIRAKRSGRVVWVLEVDEGEEVDEGILAAEIEILDEVDGRGGSKL